MYFLHFQFKWYGWSIFKKQGRGFWFFALWHSAEGLNNLQYLYKSFQTKKYKPFFMCVQWFGKKAGRLVHSNIKVHGLFLQLLSKQKSSKGAKNQENKISINYLYSYFFPDITKGQYPNWKDQQHFICLRCLAKKCLTMKIILYHKHTWKYKSTEAPTWHPNYVTIWKLKSSHIQK